MKTCPDHVALAGTAALPRDHPLRAHARECPRCRAALRAMEAFERAEPGIAVSASEIADAGDRLQEFIDAGVVAPPPRARRPRAGSIARRPLAWMAAAALVLVAVGLSQLDGGPRDFGADSAGRMRGEQSQPAAALAPALTRLDDGRANLSWDPVDGADEYVVVLHDDALLEVDRLAPAPDLSREFSPTGEWVVVIALQAGREIERSEPVRLR